MSDMPMPSWRTQPDSPAVSRRMLFVAGGLLGGVVLLGLIGWGISSMGPKPVPVVEAEATPIKERPADPGGVVIPNQDESIFERSGERRAEQLLAPARVIQAPEAPMLDRLRQQQQAATQPRTEAAPTAPAPAPAPVPAPEAQPRLAVPAPRPVAAPVAPAAPQPAPQAAPSGAGRWQIQLAALNSEAAARAHWERMVRQVPELGSRHPGITKLERDGQAPLWRLRTGGLSDGAAARALCDAVKTKGGSCMPIAP